MKILKNVILVMLMCLSWSAFAITAMDIDNTGFDKLTDEQKIQIMSQVNTMAKQTEASPTQIADTTEKWIGIGERIGQMFTGAAKEVSMGVNDFAKTPLGKVTIFIIVWQLFGSAFVHIFIGVTILMTGIWYIRKLLSQQYVKSIEYDHTQKDWLGRSKMTKTNYREMDGEEVAMYTFYYLVLIGITITTILTGI